jgi:hypothetical protein
MILHSPTYTRNTTLCTTNISVSFPLRFPFLFPCVCVCINECINDMTSPLCIHINRFFQSLGGIRQRPWSVAYSHIHLKPRPPCSPTGTPTSTPTGTPTGTPTAPPLSPLLASASVALETRRGRIESNWTATAGAGGAEGAGTRAGTRAAVLFNWSFTVPPNVYADIDLPGQATVTILGGGGVHRMTGVAMC